MSNTDRERRQFLKLATTGLAAAPLAGLGMATAASAQEQLPHLDEESEEARALNYRHDATQVGHPEYQEGQNCGNCLLYTDPSAKEWGPCAVFPGKLVAEGGWCTAYVPRG